MITLALHLYRQVMRKGRIIGLGCLVAILGLILWLSSLGGDTAENTMEAYHSALIAGGTVFSLALLIVTVAVLRDEKDGGTLPYIFMRPIPRARFAVAAILGGILSALTISAIAWVITTIVGLAIGVPLAATLPGLVLFVTASFGYAAVFVPLGYLVPRALLIGLMYVILLEGVISQALDSVAHLSIWRISIATYAGMADALPNWLSDVYVSPLTASVGGGLIKIVVILLVGWGVLTWALKERDAV